MGRSGGAWGEVEAHGEKWRLMGRSGGTWGKVKAHGGKVKAHGEK